MGKRTEKKNQEKKEARRETIRFYINILTFIALVIDKLLAWFF